LSDGSLPVGCWPRLVRMKMRHLRASADTLAFHAPVQWQRWHCRSEHLRHDLAACAPALTRLDVMLDVDTASHERLRMLSRLSALQRLDLRMSLASGDHVPIRGDLFVSAALSALVHLEFNGQWQIDADAVASLGRLSGLRTLALSPLVEALALSDAQRPVTKALGKLTWLEDLRCGLFTSASSLRALCSMRSLTSLDCFRAELWPRDFLVLRASLTRLRDDEFVRLATYSPHDVRLTTYSCASRLSRLGRQWRRYDDRCAVATSR
jgi:hypothetical protein